MVERREGGLPAENSRSKVLSVAREILSKHPSKSLTMAQVAKEMGQVTMALYKHVKNKDDLMESVAELVFAEFKIMPVETNGWEQQLASMLASNVPPHQS